MNVSSVVMRDQSVRDGVVANSLFDKQHMYKGVSTECWCCLSLVGSKSVGPDGASHVVVIQLHRGKALQRGHESRSDSVVGTKANVGLSPRTTLACPGSVRVGAGRL